MSDQPDLFPVAESLSPFAEWKRTHGVTTNPDPIPNVPEDRWMAQRACINAQGEAFGHVVVRQWADGEEAACEKLAGAVGIPTWLDGRSL